MQKQNQEWQQPSTVDNLQKCPVHRYLAWFGYVPKTSAIDEKSQDYEGKV